MIEQAQSSPKIARAIERAWPGLSQLPQLLFGCAKGEAKFCANATKKAIGQTTEQIAWDRLETLLSEPPGGKRTNEE